MAKAPWNLSWAIVAILGMGALTPAARAGEQSSSPAKAATASTDRVQAVDASGSTASEGALPNLVGQVTSVSQLSDVKPTDWAFQALQSLVERYGCIVGYPDKTYRGNRALTRYEFAAGLNACLDRVNELIAAGTADLVKKEDLLAVQKLQEEFAAELATLRGRVDALEARTATLEKQQFSTTTKLRGEVIFSISDTFGDRAVRSGNGTRLTNADRSRVTRDNKTNPIFADRIRLAFDTSFTGKDLLRTRLQARNITPYNGNLTGTQETRLGFDGNEGNSILIDKLFYRFALGNNFRVQIDAANVEFYDSLISTLSPFESSGSGAVSRFGRFSSIYRVNNPQLNNTGLSGAAGITAAYKFGDALRLEAGFSGSSASNNPVSGGGLLNGDYTAIGQIVFTPNKALTIGLTYAHSYYGPGTLIGDSANGNRANLTASIGTAYASNPFSNSATNRVGFTADSVGGAVQLRLSPKFLIGGWAGAAFAHRNRSSDDATVLYAAGYLGFPDLLKKGDLVGILVGITPHVIDNNGLTAARQDGDTPFHVEAFYRYRLTDNIAVTPGLFVLFNPEGNSSNATQYVGVIRTTFTF